jgi:hypothetical protein
MTFLPTFFFLMQKAGNCDFFKWANKEMSVYEKRLTEHLQQMKERRLANNDKVEESIERTCKERYDQLRRELGMF